MINLEELILYLSIFRCHSTYVDGIQLYDEVLIYMPQLKKCDFSIDTGLFTRNIKSDLPSNEDIQRSFIGRGYGQVGSDFHLFAREEGMTRCHVYSLPYQFQQFYYFNNSFKGGMFNKVRFMIMVDGRPFEHSFFKLISEAFPCLTDLWIFNSQPQKEKQQSSTLIIFPHLTRLNLFQAHLDYAEQFLIDKNTYLPRLLNLFIKYETLVIVTENFSNDVTPANFGKLESVSLDNPFDRPENCYQYFPLL
jgi:hypothetical protein